MKKIFLSLSVVLSLLTSCTIVRPGEAAMKQRLGKLVDKSYTGGPVTFNPFTTKVIKINTRTVEIFNVLPLPTKEGSSVNA